MAVHMNNSIRVSAIAAMLLLSGLRFAKQRYRQ